MTPKSWRDILPVDPVADVLPMMNDEELRKAGQDILENGLKDFITLWQDNSEGPDDKGDYVLLDGRNRLEAMERAGIRIPTPQEDSSNLHRPFNPKKRGVARGRVFEIAHPTEWHTNLNGDKWAAPGQVPDKAAFVISKNIRRRHLTPKQQVSLIVEVVKAANDLANVARSFSPTPGAKGGSTKDPLKQEVVEKAAEYGHSERTVERALAEKRAATTDKPKRTFVTCSECSARVADLDKHLKIKHKVKAARRGPPALETERMLEKAVMNTKEATARCARYDVLANKASLKKMLRLYDELEESISLGRDRINNRPPDKEIRRALTGEVDK